MQRVLVRILVPALALLAAGCHSSMQVNTPVTPRVAPSPGTSVVGGSIEYSSSGNSLLGILIGLGVVGAAMSEEFSPLPWRRAVPALDPSRPVQEVDCTKPLPPGGGNLRCR